MDLEHNSSNWGYKFKISSGIEISHIRKKEKWRLQQRWREKFSSQVKTDQGRWVIAGQDWYTFADNYYAHYSGFKAEVEFNEALAKQFVFICSRDDIPAYNCKCTKAPKADLFTQLLANILKLDDVYLFDLELTWTMVFVHEESFGPFFARSE